MAHYLETKTANYTPLPQETQRLHSLYKLVTAGIIGGLKMLIVEMIIRIAAIYYAAKFVVFLFRAMADHGY